MPQRLLLVDDEPDILETVRALLEFKLPNLQVTVAPSGLAAMAMLERQPFDVLVTDYRMPGMDGAQLAAEAMKRWPRMRVLMVTAYKDRDTVAAIERQA